MTSGLGEGIADHLSAITIQSLADIGYGTDPGTAAEAPESRIPRRPAAIWTLRRAGPMFVR